MKTITIERTYWSGGTLGRIPELGIYTLERPWLNNQTFVSCIPEGWYLVAPDEEGRYTGYPEVQNVVGRTEIIMHEATEVKQLEGCIAPGLAAYIGPGEVPRVKNSKIALDRIMKLGSHFRLIIKRKL